MNFLVEKLNASAIYQVAAGLFDESSDGRSEEVVIVAANASMEQPESYELWQSVVIGTMLLILILFTVVGNFFVILAILLERDLRSRPQYYLIFSLAAADLMVGLIVTPLGAWATLQQAWYLGVTLCDFWISIDVLVCTSSILHLVAIALDRYWSITDIYYNRTPKRIFFMLMCIWVLSLLISLAPIFGWKDAQFVSRVREQHVCLISQQISYQVFSTATAFYIPLCAIIIVYWKIMRAARKRFRRERDRKTVHNRAFDDTAKSKVVTVVQKPNNPVVPVPQENTTYNTASLCPVENGHVKFKMKFESTIQSTSDDERTPMQITDNPTIVNAETQFNKIHSKEKPLSSAKRISIRAPAAKRKKRVKESVETRRERKAWRTLAIITGTFVACWTPFFLVSLYRPICGCKIPPAVESVTSWLGYLNSALNPVIYTIFSMDFRMAFQRIIKRVCFVNKY
ncbi:7 transmembrane receptor (rhodopsin family) domain-containing protein [Ditylenchus destructor]|nr:7 transmembrane receptor (rhodopsin family) domain-containing protein [Ditylenchus destructor]